MKLEADNLSKCLHNVEDFLIGECGLNTRRPTLLKQQNFEDISRTKMKENIYIYKMLGVKKD